MKNAWLAWRKIKRLLFEDGDLSVSTPHGEGQIVYALIQNDVLLLLVALDSGKLIWTAAELCYANK